jgi:hypothetical protein
MVSVRQQNAIIIGSRRNTGSKTNAGNAALWLFVVAAGCSWFCRGEIADRCVALADLGVVDCYFESPQKRRLLLVALLFLRGNNGMTVATLSLDGWIALTHGSDLPLPRESSDSVRDYRHTEKLLVLSALQTGSSLLVVSDIGMGKSALAQFVADDLQNAGHAVALIVPTTPKQTLLDCATQLGADTVRDNGKQMTASQLQTSIAEFLAINPAFLLFDDAHRLPVSLRVWLLSLLDAGQPLLLFATHPPRKDIFLKLPRIELKALPPSSIRELMQTAAQELGLQLTPSQLATLQERCGGNPMLARRVIRETFLGLEVTAPDHTEWMDGTPLLIAVLLVFSAIRFLGRGLHQTDLYILGGVLAVAIGIARLLLASLPRKSNRLGK